MHLYHDQKRCLFLTRVDHTRSACKVFSWLPAGQSSDAVIHRPDLELSMTCAEIQPGASHADVNAVAAVKGDADHRDDGHDIHANQF